MKARIYSSLITNSQLKLPLGNFNLHGPLETKKKFLIENCKKMPLIVILKSHKNSKLNLLSKNGLWQLAAKLDVKQS